MRSFATTRGLLDLESPSMRLYQKSKRLGVWDPYGAPLELVEDEG
jgi:hypothetical protein